MNHTKIALAVKVTAEEKTMTSREIAAVVESRHDKVKLSIERLAAKGIFTLPPLVETSFLDSAGKKQRTTEYRVCKRDSYVIVAQLSPEFTARLVDRWQELETEAQQPQQPSFSVPQTYAEALRLAADLSDKAEALTAQVEEMQPAVAALERLTESDGTFNVREAAKQLNLKPSQLTAWMSANNWIYKQGVKSPWMAYQPRIDAGLMMHKTTAVEGSDGITTIRSQARVTAKGLTTISKTIEKANRTAKMLNH